MISVDLHCPQLPPRAEPRPREGGQGEAFLSVPGGGPGETPLLPPPHAQFLGTGKSPSLLLVPLSPGQTLTRLTPCTPGTVTLAQGSPHQEPQLRASILPGGVSGAPGECNLQVSLVSAKSWKPERPLPKLSLQPLGGAFSLGRCFWGWRVTVDGRPEPRRLRLAHPACPLPSPQPCAQARSSPPGLGCSAALDTLSRTPNSPAAPTASAWRRGSVSPWTSWSPLTWSRTLRPSAPTTP